MNRLWVRLSIYFGTFALIGVLLLVIIARLLVNDTVRQSFLPMQLQAPGGIIDTLGNYYENHGSWDGVENLMDGARATFRLWAGGMDLRVLDQDRVPIYQLLQRPGNPNAKGGADGGSSLANGQVENGPKRSAPMGDAPMGDAPMGDAAGGDAPMGDAPAGTVQSNSGPSRFGFVDGRRTPMQLPINVHGQTVGFLEARLMMIDTSAGTTQDIFEQLSQYILLIALGAGILGAIFSVAASRMLTAPLTQLANAARAIGAGNFNERLTSHGTDEVVEVATAFNEMATQLQEAEILRRNLVADVAHELRTPLSVIQGNLRAIIDDVYPLNKEEVTRLYTQSRLLSRLVNDLHELAQAEAGQLSLNKTEMDLRPLLHETLEIFAPMAEEDDVTLHAELTHTLPAVVVDSVRMRQVLHNLLANALRHTPAGGTITIASSTERSNGTDNVVIAIRDTGDGIAREHLPYVFDRFYRTDRARARDTGGAGLGLAIVRAIVQAHNGQITAASEGIGHGSTFTLILPL